MTQTTHIASVENAIEDHSMNPSGDEFSSSDTLGQLPGRRTSTPFEACLRPLIDGLGWAGEDRHIFDALPHLEPIEDLQHLQAVLWRIGYKSLTSKVRFCDLGADDLPCVMLLSEAQPVVVLERIDEYSFLVFDSVIRDFRDLPVTADHKVCCFVDPIPVGTSRKERVSSNWFSESLESLRKPIIVVFALTFAANFLALAAPIYVMNVYDIVIAGKAIETLLYLFAMVAMVFLFEMYIRRKRGELVAYIGARMSAALLNASLEKIMRLPVGMIESASIGSQILKLRKFEQLHGFFTGPIASAALDLPFILIFFAAIALINPLLALIPIALAVVFAVLAMVLVPSTTRNTKAIGESQNIHQRFLIDTIGNINTIKQLRAETNWQKRFSSLSRDLVLQRFRTQFFDSTLGSIAQFLMMTAGIVTLGVGALLSMDGVLSTGGLIAVMMFIWRVLAPIQSVFLGINKIGQFFDSIKQVNLLMNISTERDNRRPSVFRRFSGRITFESVSFRYGPKQEPVFRNMTFDVKPGEVVAISSATASGKSTILKMIIGLYQPQAGTVFLDGLNIRQLDPMEVRASIGYTPLEPVFFYGSIAQNLRMAMPSATDDCIHQALSDAGLDMNDPIFPDGIETRLSNKQLATMPDGALQSLSLARMYCKNASINLLNDPAAYLDERADELLMKKLCKLRGKSTVIIVTNRPQHHAQCDRVLTLRNGAVESDQMVDKSLHNPTQGVY